MNGIAEEKLYGDVPQQPMEIWTDEYRTDENVLVLVRDFLCRKDGPQLAFHFQSHHAAAKQSFRLFFTTDVQEFVQTFLPAQIGYSYPFLFCEPEDYHMFDHMKPAGMFAARLNGTG